MEGFGVFTAKAELSDAAADRVAATFEIEHSTEVIKQSSGALRLIACVQAPDRLTVERDERRVILRIGDVWLDAGEDRGRRVPTPAEMLDCWKTDGAEGMKRFDGCWSLVACDLTNETALILTDRFNSNPIYWSKVGTNWTIGSTVQSAALARSLPVVLDRVAIFQFMHFTRMFGTRTLVEGVQITRPGSWLELGQGPVKGGKWFSFDYAPESRTVDYWADSMADAFQTAARNVLAPGNTSLLLSGGLDSRLVLASLDQPVECVHVNAFSNLEAKTALTLAEAHGSPFDLSLRPLDHYAEIVRQGTAIGSASHNFHHAHCLGLLQMPANRTVIHGWVPEVYFRGTNLPHRYIGELGIRSPFVQKIKRDNIVDQMFYNLKYSQSAGRPFRFFRPELQGEYQSTLHETLHEVVREAQNHSADPLDWFLWADTHYIGRYPSHLWSISLRAEHRERSVHMQNGILDLHLRMPIAMRSNNDIWLAALRRLNPKIAAIADANTGYRPSISANIYFLIRTARWGRKRARKLLGYSLNAPVAEHSWFTDSSWPDLISMYCDYTPFRHQLHESALGTDVLPENIFDTSALPHLFEEVRITRDWRAIEVIFATATLGSWISQFA